MENFTLQQRIAKQEKTVEKLQSGYDAEYRKVQDFSVSANVTDQVIKTLKKLQKQLTKEQIILAKLEALKLKLDIHFMNNHKIEEWMNKPLNGMGKPKTQLYNAKAIENLLQQL